MRYLSEIEKYSEWVAILALIWWFRRILGAVLVDWSVKKGRLGRIGSEVIDRVGVRVSLVWYLNVHRSVEECEKGYISVKWSR